MKLIVNLLLIIILCCFFFKDKIYDVKDKFSGLTERKRDMEYILDKYELKHITALTPIVDGVNNYESKTSDGEEHVVLKIIHADTTVDKINHYVHKNANAINYTKDISDTAMFLKGKDDNGVYLKTGDGLHFISVDSNNDLILIANKSYITLEPIGNNNYIFKTDSNNYSYIIKIIPICEAYKQHYKNDKAYYEKIYNSNIAKSCKKTFNNMDEKSQLEYIGQHFDVNSKIIKYLNDELNKTDTQIYNYSDYLFGVADDADRYIQRDYVINALNYQKDKIDMEKKMTQVELFQDVALFNNDDILTEEEEIMLYPQLPEHFYGEYKIRDGQYLILNNFKIILSATGLSIKNTNNFEILYYPLLDQKPIIAPNLPLTTIEIILNKSIINKDNQIVRNTSDQILIQKQKNLLYHLGIKNSKFYLFGNDYLYRLYNYNRTLIFHLERLTTTLI